MEILIVLGCLYTGYRFFKKPGEHFFDTEAEISLNINPIL